MRLRPPSAIAIEENVRCAGIVQPGSTASIASVPIDPYGLVLGIRLGSDPGRVHERARLRQRKLGIGQPTLDPGEDRDRGSRDPQRVDVEGDGHEGGVAGRVQQVSRGRVPGHGSREEDTGLTSVGSNDSDRVRLDAGVGGVDVWQDQRAGHGEEQPAPVGERLGKRVVRPGSRRSELDGRRSARRPCAQDAPVHTRRGEVEPVVVAPSQGNESPIIQDGARARA